MFVAEKQIASNEHPDPFFALFFIKKQYFYKKGAIHYVLFIVD